MSGGPDDFEEIATAVTGGGGGDDAPTAQHADVGIVAELQAMLTRGDVKTLALYHLADEFVVGRGSACDWQLDDNSLSRRHATFSWDGKKLSVEDLGSANGTRIDGRAIAGRSTVPTGATVQLGTVNIRLTEPSIVSVGSNQGDPDRESTRTVPIAQLERSSKPAAGQRAPHTTAGDARSTAAAMPAVRPPSQPAVPVVPAVPQRPPTPTAGARVAPPSAAPQRPSQPAVPAVRPSQAALPTARPPTGAPPARPPSQPAVPAAAPRPPAPSAPPYAAPQQPPATAPAMMQAAPQAPAASQQAPSSPSPAAGGRSFAPGPSAQLETRLTGGVHPRERADARGTKVFRPAAFVAGPDEPTGRWDPQAVLRKENEKPLETTRLVEAVKQRWRTNRRPFVLAGATVWVGVLLAGLWVHEQHEREEAEDAAQEIAPVIHSGTPLPKPPRPIVTEPLPAVTPLDADGGAGALATGDGGGPPAPPPIDREAVLADAIAAYDQGKVDDALAAFRRLADADPQNAGARYMVDLLEELAAKGHK